MSFYRRRLPHWHPSGQPLFLTWHLYGSLPSRRYPPPKAASAGKAFVYLDRFLDDARCGPTWLRQADVARLVVDAIEFCAIGLGFNELDSFVVMPNHVYLLILPKVPPPDLLQSLKGFTARRANRLLDRTGQPFWQHESYDRWVRNALERDRIRRYIEWNPVRAALVVTPEHYPWSSAAAKSGRNA